MATSRKPAQATEAGPRPPITLQRVKSSQISAVGYDKATQTLALQFKPFGGEKPMNVYHYPAWGPSNHAEFMAAESLGTFFGRHIKGREFKKYTPEPLPPAQEG